MGCTGQWVKGLLAISLKNSERWILCAKKFRTDPQTTQMLVLDVLDNMLHLRLSDDHMKSVLWMLKELDVPDAPSFYAL
jgi:hypothetical protein